MSKEKIGQILFLLYSLSLVSSLGMMETLSVVIVVLFLVLLVKDLLAGNWKIKKIAQFFPIKISVLFFLSSAVSAILFSQHYVTKMSSIGSNRGVFFVIAFCYLWHNRVREFFLKYSSYFGFALAVMCLYTIFQFFSGIDLVRGTNLSIEPMGSFYRPSAFFRNPLTLVYCAGTIFFAILPLQSSQWFLLKPIKIKAFYYIVLGLLFLSIVASGSRGAWLGSFILSLYYALEISRKSLFLFFKRIGFSLAGVSLLLVNSSIRARVISIADPANISNYDHISIWKVNFLLWIEHFWWGVGFKANNYMTEPLYGKHNILHPRNLGPEHHAHSDILQALAGSGIIGGTLYLLMICSFMFSAYKSKEWFLERNEFYSRVCFGLLLAQLFFHFGGLFQCNYIDREINHLLMYIWFLVFAMSSLRKKMVLEHVK